MTFWTLRRVILVGLLVQFGVAPLSAHALDPYVWYNTARTVVGDHGSLYPHPQPAFWYYAYPPTWAGFLVLVWGLYAPLAPSFHAQPVTGAHLQGLLGVSFQLGAPLIPDWWFLLLVKTPIILFSLATAFLLRKVVIERFDRPELGTRAFALYFLNPYVIWISSVWGMFDAIPTFFALLASVLLLDRRYLYSGLTFGVAVSLKYFPALILLALVVGLRRPTGRPFLRFIAGFAGLLAAVSIPFLISDFSGYLQGVLSPSSGQAVGNLSIWTIVRWSGTSTLPDWLVGFDLGAIALAIGGLAWWIGRQRSMTNDPGLWVELSALGLLVFYVIFPAVNNQYITWIIPYLAVNVALNRERPVLLIALTVLALLYTVFTVSYYSFFLPILTINPSLTWLVPRMYAIPYFGRAVAIVLWVVMAVSLVLRVRRARGIRGVYGIAAWLDRLAARMTSVPPERSIPSETPGADTDLGGEPVARSTARTA
ncbi:MAG: glycosyltransferase 87 family protein [Thermoplasmata archaeon]|nr:glycosyltransferase 87 family protein [Thermoplasmata archaeon]